MMKTYTVNGHDISTSINRNGSIVCTITLKDDSGEFIHNMSYYDYEMDEAVEDFAIATDYFVETSRDVQYA